MLSTETSIMQAKGFSEGSVCYLSEDEIVIFCQFLPLKNWNHFLKCLKVDGLDEILQHSASPFMF